MAYRMLEVTIHSAHNLENKRRWNIFNMRVHCRVIFGEEKEKRTKTDTHGGPNPAWYATMDFKVWESMLESSRTTLRVKLYCSRVWGADKYVGEINIPIKDLFNYTTNPTVGTVLTFPVQKGSANSQGTLILSFKFGLRVFAGMPTMGCANKSYIT